MGFYSSTYNKNITPKTMNDSFISQILNRGKKELEGGITDIATNVTNQVTPQIKQICYEGSKVAIKDYSVPIVSGIAVFTIVVFVAGVGIGKWLDDQGERK
jgi:hypothetical protein